MAAAAGGGGGGGGGGVGLCCNPNGHRHIFFYSHPPPQYSLPPVTIKIRMTITLLISDRSRRSSSSTSLTPTVLLLSATAPPPPLMAIVAHSSRTRSLEDKRQASRIERLWQQFFWDPSQWWDKRFDKVKYREPHNFGRNSPHQILHSGGTIGLTIRHAQSYYFWLLLWLLKIHAMARWLVLLEFVGVGEQFEIS